MCAQQKAYLQEVFQLNTVYSCVYSSITIQLSHYTAVTLYSCHNIQLYIVYSM